MDERTTLVVDRARIDQVELRTTPLAPLADGHVRLRIEPLALTANTITYAQFGDLLGYWGFYPVDLPWGAVPAIGWATVAESAVAGVDVGARLYGWYPMATSVDLRAAATADGLRDDGEHRLAHAPTYRSFTADPAVSAATAAGGDDEERHALLRGLSGTGQLIAGFLSDDRFAGTEQVLVLSASSKTAAGYAFAARQARERTGSGPEVVGFTNERNEAFVRDLGIYDEVRTYASVDAGVAPRSTAIVDVSGVASVVAALHAQLGDRIVHSMVVGKSHHDAAPAEVSGGPAPELFFAPSEVERQIALVGADGFRTAIAEGATAFVEDSRRWLEVERHRGPEAFAAAWARALSGEVPPSVGVVASLHR